MNNIHKSSELDVTAKNSETKISLKEKIAISILSIVALLLATGIALYINKSIYKNEPPEPKLNPSEYNNLIVTTALLDKEDNNKNYIIRTDGTINTYYLAPFAVDFQTELSADGKWIAYTKNHYENDSYQSRQSDIYLMQVNGSQPILISSQLNSFSPAWSPDSRWIAYQYQDRYGWGDGKIKSGIVITNISCLLGQELCSSVSTDLNLRGAAPSWSPDGTRIAYNGDVLLPNDKSVSHIFVYDIYKNSPPIDLTNSSKRDFGYPKWSPDGTKILTICSMEINRGYREKICVMNSDGSNLTELNTPSELNYISAPPEWSPDGLKIAFISSVTNEGYANLGFCWDNCYYPKALFIMTNNGSNLTRLDSVDGRSIIWFEWYPYK